MRLRRPLVAYFVLAYAIAWTGVALAAARDDLRLVFLAMLLGPSTASLVLHAALHERPALRAPRRVDARWYLAPLVAPALLVVVLVPLAQLSPAYAPAGGRPISPSFVALALGVGVAAGLCEELGWTAFAAPRLLRRFDATRAGLVLGALWAVWHLPADFVGRALSGGAYVAHALEWLVALVAFRVLMTRIYARTRSLLLAVLLHASFTGAQALLWPTAAPPRAELLWYGLFAAALCVVVVAGFGRAPGRRSDAGAAQWASCAT